jgi:hypothetical protein
VEINTPILTSNDAEGAGEQFKAVKPGEEKVSFAFLLSMFFFYSCASFTGISCGFFLRVRYERCQMTYLTWGRRVLDLLWTTGCGDIRYGSLKSVWDYFFFH